jgi:hypothetical protein
MPAVAAQMIITTGRCHLLLTGERFLGLWLAALGGAGA